MTAAQPFTIIVLRTDEARYDTTATMAQVGLDAIGGLAITAVTQIVGQNIVFTGTSRLQPATLADLIDQDLQAEYAKSWLLVAGGATVQR